MISAIDVFTEFVNELGDEYVIDAINDQGLAFYYLAQQSLKFSIVMPPMFGVEDGFVGLIVTRVGYPYIDCELKLEDPLILDKIKERVEINLKGLTSY